ncbi:lysosomal acid glucosylceramidase-like [Tubulanus polymorphus]|uniref:lysosomal acid glucosylceramidase-like n=1 Tax=Tubulanus polymorphus TaxID=672921 RepID=UPI003DA4D2D3
MLLKVVFSLHLLLTLSTVGICFDFQPCDGRDFGLGSIVCVCNETYCDNIEPNKPLDPRKKFAVYQSDKAGKRLKKSIGSISVNANGTDDEVIIEVSLQRAYQTMVGFGGAITDAAVINAFSLNDKARENLMKSYYSPDGIEYSVARLPIGSCDFSTRPYSYDDSNGDFELANFTLAKEDLQYKIPFVQKVFAMSKRNLTLFASPWSAPAWMKTNKNLTGNGTLIGPVGGKYYQTWALYFVKFLQEYAKKGIKFWGLTAQNEPSDGLLYKFRFQCTGFTAAQQRDFIALNLGPTLEKNGFGHVKLMVLDDSRFFLPGWADTIFSNPANLKYVAGIAVHWYEDVFIGPSLLEKTHVKYPNVFIMATEACASAMPWEQRKVLLGYWEYAERYAHSMIQDIQHWAVGWTDWNIALDLQGGPNWVKNYVDSPIIVDAKNQIFYKQPMYYAMGHFSKFIPRRCIRIGSEANKKTKLEFVSFLCPGKYITTVVLNREDFSIPFHLHDSMSGYINSIAAPRSILTFVWWVY